MSQLNNLVPMISCEDSITTPTDCEGPPTPIDLISSEESCSKESLITATKGGNTVPLNPTMDCVNHFPLQQSSNESSMSRSPGGSSSEVESTKTNSATETQSAHKRDLETPEMISSKRMKDEDESFSGALISCHNICILTPFGGSQEGEKDIEGEGLENAEGVVQMNEQDDDEGIQEIDEEDIISNMDWKEGRREEEDKDGAGNDSDDEKSEEEEEEESIESAHIVQERRSSRPPCPSALALQLIGDLPSHVTAPARFSRTIICLNIRNFTFS